MKRYKSIFKEQNIRLGRDEIICDYCANYSPNPSGVDAGDPNSCFYVKKLGRDYVENRMNGFKTNCIEFEEV